MRTPSPDDRSRQTVPPGDRRLTPGHGSLLTVALATGALVVGTGAIGLALSGSGPGPRLGGFPILGLAGLTDLTLLVAVLVTILGRERSRAGRQHTAFFEGANAYLGSLSPDDLKLLLKLPTRIHWNAPPAESLDSMLQDLTGVLGAQRGVLFLPGPDGDLTRVAEVLTSSRASDEVARFEDALAREATKRRAGLFLPAGSHPQFLGIATSRPLSRRASWIAVPLPTSDGPGALVLTATGVRGIGLVRGHVELLDLVAGSIARCSESAAKIEMLAGQLEALRNTHQRFLEERRQQIDSARRGAGERAKSELQGYAVDRLRKMCDQMESPEDGRIRTIRESLEELAHDLSVTFEAGVAANDPAHAIELDELIKGSVALQSYDLKRIGIDTRLELSCRGVRAGRHRERLEQLIKAMVQHAMARLREAPAPRVIVARTLRTAQKIRLVIRDSGSPLSVDELARLLSPTPGTAAKALQAAARITSELNGELQVASPPGMGLEQILELPDTVLRIDRRTERTTQDSTQKEFTDS